MRTAAYARYSSDSQRAASLDDQLRNVRAYCVRQGWPAPTVYQDAAITGTRDDRPGYLALVAAVDRREFDVVVVDELSRLSRDIGHTDNLLKRFDWARVRLVGVSDGLDTGRDGHELETGVKTVIAAHQVREIAKRTHRGLTGRALAGASAGGRPYGYRVAGTGQRQIDEAQAAVVRRIFEAFAAGTTPRRIATDLNAERIPSPRDSTWMLSAIYGDGKRGIGILANTIYIGRQIWNRSKWTKHPDTGRRLRQERPENEWVVTEHPELAIVTPELWEACQARLRATRNRSSQQRAEGRGTGGREHRKLLSGLLRCGDCGGPLVLSGRGAYACSRARDRGTCTSRIRVPQAAAETALLAGIKQELLSEQAFRRFERDVRAFLKAAQPDLGDYRRRLTEADQVKANLLAALRAGIITPSTKAELLAAEAACDKAQRDLDQLSRSAPSQLLPRAREVWERMVNALANTNAPSAREALRELIGDQIRVQRRESGEIWAEIPAGGLQLSLVAGAGFEPTTFGL